MERFGVSSRAPQEIDKDFAEVGRDHTRREDALVIVEEAYEDQKKDRDSLRITGISLSFDRVDLMKRRYIFFLGDRLMAGKTTYKLLSEPMPESELNPVKTWLSIERKSER